MQLRLTTAVILTCLFAAATATAKKPVLLVVHGGENAVGIYDAKTYKLIGTVATGNGPHEVVASPDGRFAYVTDYNGIDNTISIIDIAKQKRTGTVNVKPNWRPHGIDISKDGKHLYVTCEATRSVAEVDIAARKVSRSFQIREDQTHMVAVSPNGGFLLATNLYGSTASVVDLSQGKRVRNLVVGKGCEGVKFSPDGKEAWVANGQAQSISVIDTETWRQIVALHCLGYPNRIAFTPDGSRIFVNSPTMSHLNVFDRKTRTSIAEIRTGQSPLTLVMEPNGKRLFVANHKDDTISVIDTGTLEVVHTFDTGKSPDGMAWAP